VSKCEEVVVLRSNFDFEGFRRRGLWCLCNRFFSYCGAGHGIALAQRPFLVLDGLVALFPIVSLLPRMIRRNPTLIAMSDADVQDVRNMLAKQAEGVKSPNSSANVKSRQCPPPQPPAAAVHVTDEAKRRREAREERLGVTN
jgi:hypothetical protein